MGRKETSPNRTWVSDLNYDMHQALDRHRAKVVLGTLQTTIASGNYREVRAIITREKYPEEVRTRLLEKYTDVAVMKRFEIIKYWRPQEAVKELRSISQDNELGLSLREKALLECIPILEEFASQKKDTAYFSILGSMKDSTLDAATDKVKKAAAEALGRAMQMRQCGPIDLKDMREQHRELASKLTHPRAARGRRKTSVRTKR